jgi:RNA 3'-terminal phosphate cyclase (ATP)
MLSIDGSIGEGGGQILRSATTISVLTGIPIEVSNIRANRKDSGLKQQHVKTIHLLSEIFNVYAENVKLGAEWIRFNSAKKEKSDIESKFQNNTLAMDIGTAGSIPLLLQSLIPAIAISKRDLKIRLIGGTDVKYSPTIDYVQYVLRDAFSRIGIVFDLEVQKRGYYPKGQVIVDVDIKKVSEDLHSIDFCNFKDTEPSIISTASNLPRHVPERQIEYAITTLEKKGIKHFKHKSALENASSPGSSILIYSSSESGIYLGSDAIGEKGIKAETIGYNAATRFISNYESRVCIDSNLADMLVLPLSFVKGTSRFKVSEITQHLATNLDLIKLIVGISYQIEKVTEREYIVTVKGNPVI